MPLVKNGKIVDDPYLAVADDAPLPDGAAVIVSAARLLANGGDVPAADRADRRLVAEQSQRVGAGAVPGPALP